MDNIVVKDLKASETGLLLDTLSFRLRYDEGIDSKDRDRIAVLQMQIISREVIIGERVYGAKECHCHSKDEGAC